MDILSISIYQWLCRWKTCLDPSSRFIKFLFKHVYFECHFFFISSISCPGSWKLFVIGEAESSGVDFLRWSLGQHSSRGKTIQLWTKSPSFGPRFTWMLDLVQFFETYLPYCVQQCRNCLWHLSSIKRKRVDRQSH